MVLFNDGEVPLWTKEARVRIGVKGQAERLLELCRGQMIA